jgi:uncharacterized membrane protein YhaH (DUF805 family)
MSSIISGFTNLFNFSGCTNRKDFWIYIIPVSLVIISMFTASLFLHSGATVLTDSRTAVDSLPYGYPLTLYLIFIILTAAVICRRIHDVGWSGWLTILSYMNPIFIIAFGLAPGSKQQLNLY